MVFLSVLYVFSVKIWFSKPKYSETHEFLSLSSMFSIYEEAVVLGDGRGTLLLLKHKPAQNTQGFSV